MPPLEALAAVFGLANIILLSRRSVWNFPFGMAMVSIYLIVFIDTKLYSAVLLQGFFLITQAWGWWQWQRVADVTQKVAVASLSSLYKVRVAAATAALALLLGLLTSRHTDAAVPWLDATNTSLSVAAQFLTMARRVEAWPLWVAVNTLSLGLYASQSLWITTGLYAMFLILALWSWRSWQHAA